MSELDKFQPAKDEESLCWPTIQYVVPAWSSEQDEHVKSTSEEVDVALPTCVSVSKILPGSPLEFDSINTFVGLVPEIWYRPSDTSVRVAVSVGTKEKATA
jgi:hypothetical protein